MKDYLRILSVKATEVLDSRGNPTVQVEVVTEGGFTGKALVPSGASTGKFEMKELRDNEEGRFHGKGVLRAVENVNRRIAPKIENLNVYDQEGIDNLLVNLDGTDDLSSFGANAILGVSMAVCMAAADSLGMELYNYIGGINSSKKMPIPMMNIVNGGKHADNSLNIQEFMIIPVNASSAKDGIKMCSEIYHTLKKILKSNGYSTSVGDEGGFAPNFKSEEEAFNYIIEAIKQSGYRQGKDVALGIDVASSEMFDEAVKRGTSGYLFWKNERLFTEDELINYYNELVQKYPIISIEDGLSEESWDGWKKITSKFSNFKVDTINSNDELGNETRNLLLVGDDLFVTNIDRLNKGIENGVANAVLIKPNQIGTITDTLKTIEQAKKHGYKIVISHRSGETEDTFIADLAVAVNADYIKSGAPCRSERTAKYNRLINIEND